MNESGVTPVGDRLLVLVDAVDEGMKDSVIHVPETVKDRHQMGVSTGIVVEMGPDCYQHTIKTVERQMGNGLWRTVERCRTGYSEQFCAVGDRVAFAQYSGRDMPGLDGKIYRLMNDEDVTAVIDKEVDFTEFRQRESM